MDENCNNAAGCCLTPEALAQIRSNIEHKPLNPRLALNPPVPAEWR
jgi:hypothetical protein